MEARMTYLSTSLKRKALMAYGAVVALVLLAILIYSLYLSWNPNTRAAVNWKSQSEAVAQPDTLVHPQAFLHRSLLVY
jgi:hypothetical protein